MKPPPFDPALARGEPCAHHDAHDLAGQPIGPECGRPATQVIYWRDKRFSPSCERHGVELLEASGRARVLCCHPIPKLRSAGEDERVAASCFLPDPAKRRS